MAQDFDPKAALERVRAEAHKAYPRNPGRLEQLDSALATADMALDHLAEEEMRNADLAQRVREDELAAERHRHQVAPAYRRKD